MLRHLLVINMQGMSGNLTSSKNAAAASALPNLEKTGFCRKIARAVSDSPLFASNRKLYEENLNNWNFPLSKIQKLRVGSYLILRDYGDGLFPPTFTDQQSAYAAEIDYHLNLPGMEADNVSDVQLRKPFWHGFPVRKYLTDFIKLTLALEHCGIRPPQRVLELGCGGGWMAEFLGLMKYSVLGTSIAPHDIGSGQKRMDSLKAKGVEVDIGFRVAPMETVADATRDLDPFDAVFVFEALHHAFDWRKSVDSSFACLKPGGWFLICNEPNWLHTFISYRVAKLSKTHEIGFVRRDIIEHLKRTGFRNIEILEKSPRFGYKPHWIVAQK